MKKIVLFAAAAAVVLSSCSTPEDNKTTKGNAIAFRGVVEKNTRASLVNDTKELTSFFVHTGKAPADNDSPFSLGYLNTAVYNEDPKGATANWIYNDNTPVYYPTDGLALNFYAYAPVKDYNMTAQPDIVTTDITNGGAGLVTFEYEVPNDQSGINTACDLLVASKEGMLSSANNGQVALLFDHALSAVTFTATNEHPLTSALTYVISKIEITGLDNAGTFTYANALTTADAKWDVTYTGGITYTAGVPASGVSVAAGATAVRLLSANDVMMMLPQTFSVVTAPQVKITFSLQQPNGTFLYNNAERILNFPSTTTAFAMGQLYNLAFSFGGTNDPELVPITFSVDVTPWVEAPVTLVNP